MLRARPGDSFYFDRNPEACRISLFSRLATRFLEILSSYYSSFLYLASARLETWGQPQWPYARRRTVHAASHHANNIAARFDFDISLAASPITGYGDGSLRRAHGAGAN